MSPFALLLGLAGLSQSEAARYLDVNIDTVKAWGSGRRSPRAAVIDELRGLIARQSLAADKAIATVAEVVARTGPAPEEIELGYPADDHEAQSLGWPCVGAWRGMASRVVAAIDVPVRLVPRGSTPATAGAADAHERRR